MTSQSGRVASLQIEITPKFLGDDIRPNSLCYQSAASERFSITRVSYLLSEFALQRKDGSWLKFSNSVAWIDLEMKRNSIWLEPIPSDEYCAVRFLVGVNNNLNHADVATFPATHPLNPNVNGLHWSWQGGFIFLALEGLWRNGAGELDGWAYHLARDTNATLITIRTPLTVTNETKLALDFDLSTLLNTPRPLSFAKDGSSTHSRDGDPVSAALTANLSGAFHIRNIVILTNTEFSDPISPPKLSSARARRGAGLAGTESAREQEPLYLPAKFTAFPFQMSATFPMPDLPRDNPLIVERVELGKKLFFDKELSVNYQQSCADCHSPEKAFTDGRRTARGAEGEFGPRNSMPLFNLAWKKEFFWDGRAKSLREQVLQPIQNPIEMHESLTNLCAKLSTTDKIDYAALFTAAFGSPAITSEKIALALENYLLTLTSFNAKFDRVLRGEEKFTDEEQRGFELFSTEYDPRRGQFGADCFHCHGGPLFQSQSFANNGSDSAFTDIGREKVTGKASDRGKFSVPSLRNVELTAPYMHDGRFRTLEDVIRHYSSGVVRSATLDPNLAKHPDGGVPLSNSDKRALVAFLKTLTDAQFSSAGK